MVLFSLVGCVGMMGYHSSGRMVGVNNLNSTDARSGVIWPALVRATLGESELTTMRDHLCKAQVTSAHITVSCIKFFGTPPPIINNPEPLDCILISVNSLNSLMEFIVICFFGFFSW